MISLLLVYPFFMPRHDKSEFRFPPLGVAYIAAAVRNSGREVSILDCTFMSREKALAAADSSPADVVGIYSMITMKDDSIMFARALAGRSRLIVAGGPLPTVDPGPFLEDFDFIVKGEGEKTMVELLEAFEEGIDPMTVPGLVRGGRGEKKYGAGSAVGSFYGQAGESSLPRKMEPNIDAIPFPARDLLPNEAYIGHGKRKYGYAITTVMSTRGCPFNCEFCSNAVFGLSYRERSPDNVLDEVEEAISLGYDRIHFADDVFTLRRERVLHICEGIKKRRLSFSWECLGRVDSIDREVARAMREAGCDRIFFGIESGCESILKLMNKKITTLKAYSAVESARQEGIRAGAFFILFYPGDTDDTVLETMRFALSLPLDYLSFSMPYPIPGTALYERVKDRAVRNWRQEGGIVFDHKLIFDADFSEAKMRFGILKGQIEFALKKKFGRAGEAAMRVFRIPADRALRMMK